jgi:hypothetical protein
MLKAMLSFNIQFFRTDINEFFNNCQGLFIPDSFISKK